MAETAQEQRYRVAARALRARMVRRIVAGGGLTDPAWRRAFAEVPRHVFVPVSVPGGNRSGYPGGDPSGEPGGDPSGYPGGANDARSVLRRLAAAYADRPIATRVVAGELVSSVSQPSLMAQMCQALDVRDGQRVLEIGAGTGYNAALLAHRLGPGAVTTVDLDPEITTAARANLAAYGTSAARSVVVVTGDGALGHPDGAPYDRIVATCELPAVPPAWLAQVCLGGLILAPVANGLVLLTVHGPERAEGRFLPTSAYFVPLRGAGVSAAPVAGPFSGHHPARTRFGLTVHGTRQWLWLDDPRGPRTWPLTPAAG